MHPSQKQLDVLKKHFGHNEFRPKQLEIINSIVEDKRDNCVVMATGYGKSLCFQFPPVFCNGLAIVVSPLISLMQDQVTALEMFNIPACFLGSAQKKQKEVITRLLNDEYRLLYITPELCSSEYGEDVLNKIKESKINVVLIAIDEAHCVSEWGMDFRKSYRNLGKLRHSFPGVPYLTVTATATPAVIKDIIRSLKLKNPLMVSTSFDRPNLFLSASIKGSDILEDIQDLFLKFKMMNTTFSDSGSKIIYCATKKIADNVYSLLKGTGMKCSLYHANLSLTERIQAQKDFSNDKINVMVATIAFGMGIDKPDVRAVVHVGAPKDLETYYQEIGRAGRDGLPSFCHVLYSQGDFTLNKFFVKHLQGKFREHKEEMSRIMERYLQTIECRRKIIIEHFDPGFKLEQNIRCCDNCSITRRKSSSTNVDSSSILIDDAILFLNTVNELNGKYGVTMVVLVLRGSNNKRIPKFAFNSKLYGAGSEKSELWWKYLGSLLIRECLLEQYAVNSYNTDRFPVNCVRVSTRGQKYLMEGGSKDIVKLNPTKEMIPLIKQLEPSANQNGWISLSGKDNPDVSTAISQAEIRKTALEDIVYDELIKLRLSIASYFDCMPYVILSHRTMHYLAQMRPTTLKELSFVEGFSDTKLEKFGQQCLDCIQKSIARYENKTSTVPSTAGKGCKRFVSKILSYRSEEGTSEENVENSSDNNAGCTQENENKRLDITEPVVSPADTVSLLTGDEDFFSGLEDFPICSPALTSASERYFTALEDFNISSPDEAIRINIPVELKSSDKALSDVEGISPLKRIKLDNSNISKKSLESFTSTTNSTGHSNNVSLNDGNDIQNLTLKLEMFKDKKKIVKKKIKI